MVMYASNLLVADLMSRWAAEKDFSLTRNSSRSVSFILPTSGYSWSSARYARAHPFASTSFAQTSIAISYSRSCNRFRPIKYPVDLMAYTVQVRRACSDLYDLSCSANLLFSHFSPRGTKNAIRSGNQRCYRDSRNTRYGKYKALPKSIAPTTFDPIHPRCPLHDRRPQMMHARIRAKS